MKKPTVVIAEAIAPEATAWLAERAQVVSADPRQLHGALATADALVVRTYTTVDSNLLTHAPALKVVARAGVGLENIDLKACQQRGIQVVYTPEANTESVAEYVMALMLDDARPRPNLAPPYTPANFHAQRSQALGRELSGTP